MFNLDKLWKGKRLSIETKKRLISTLIWPVATYWSESWTMKKTVLKRFSRLKYQDIEKFFVFRGYCTKKEQRQCFRRDRNDLELNVSWSFWQSNIKFSSTKCVLKISSAVFLDQNQEDDQEGAGYKMWKAG